MYLMLKNNKIYLLFLLNNQLFKIMLKMQFLDLNHINLQFKLLKNKFKMLLKVYSKIAHLIK